MSGETDKGQQLPVALRWSGSSGMAGMLACVAVAGAVAVWARWPVWVVLAAGLSAQAAVMTFIQVRPREVPAGLADPLAKLEASGFRRVRLHPFTCTEARPHAHVRGELGMVKVALEDETDGPR